MRMRVSSELTQGHNVRSKVGRGAGRGRSYLRPGVPWVRDALCACVNVAASTQRRTAPQDGGGAHEASSAERVLTLPS